MITSDAHRGDRSPTPALLGVGAESPPGDEVRRRLGLASGVRTHPPGVPTDPPGGRPWSAPGTPDTLRGGRRAARAGPARSWRGPPLHWTIIALLGGWPRRVIALGFLFAAAATWLHGVGAAHPDSGGTPSGVTAVVVAARDLSAGTRLSAADVRSAALPADMAPAGVFRQTQAAVGRVVAGPVRRGEPLTNARVLGPGLATGLAPPASVAVPVRLADAQVAAIVRPGDRIDLLGTPIPAAEPGGRAGRVTEAVPADPQTPHGPAADSDAASDQPAAVEPATATLDATVLAADVRVLAVLSEPGAIAADGVLVVVAVSDRMARRLTGAAGQQRLGVALRPP